jgi:oligopeptide/dipeptide ABC transporter ATP-binding protein
MTVIAGSVPGQGDWPPGCRFAPRCPLAEDACRAEIPASADLADGRRVACRRHADDAAWGRVA